MNSDIKMLIAVFVLFVLAVSSAIFIVLSHNNNVPTRRAIVYSNDGKVIKEYNGKIEYVRRSNNGVRFWHEDRRIIIQGGIIIVEDE